MDDAVTLTSQQPADAITVPLGDHTPTTTWQMLAMAPGLQRALIDGVRAVLAEQPGNTRFEQVERLVEAGVDVGEQGPYLASVLAALDQTPEHDGHVRALLTVAMLGSEQGPSGVRYGFEALEPVLAPALETGQDLRIAFQLTDEWFDRRRDQRTETCRILMALGAVCDVRVVGTARQRARLLERHRTDLPGVSDDCSAGGSSAPVGSPDEAAVGSVVARLDPDGRAVRLLRDVRDTASETATFHQLYAEHPDVSDSRIRQVLVTDDESLETLGLVETYETGTGKAAELTKLGSAALARVEAEYGQQAELPLAETGTGKRSHDRRVDASQAREGGGATQTTAGPAPAADGEDRRVDVAFLARSEHHAAVGAAPEQGVGLVDAPVEPIGDGDGTPVPGWSHNAAADRVVTSAVYRNPMQYWVCTALSLASHWTFDRVLTPERLDGGTEGGFGGTSLSDTGLLRDRRCVGYLSDDLASAEEYLDELADARDQLYAMTSKLARGEYDDENAYRGAIQREALGLAGTVVHLLDSVGVSVTREVRIPQFSRHFGDNDEDRHKRQALVKTLAIGTAIQSHYGEYAFYRQVFESREDKQSVPQPDVDAADPLGEFIGNAVCVGPGVSSLEEELRTALKHPADMREDAPDIAIAIGVDADAGTSRRAYAQAVRAACEAKDLRATRESVSVMQALTATVYDAVEALSTLGQERHYPGRDVRLDEIRYALRHLPTKRLLPSVTPTARDVVGALLAADEPLRQCDLAEAAGRSARSVRTHLGRLVDLDLAIEDDGTYRINLPRGSEEHDAGFQPWYTLPSRERPGDSRDASAVGVVQDVLDTRLPPGRCEPSDPLGQALFWPPDLEAAFGEWPWLGRWGEVIAALATAVATQTTPDAEAADAVFMGTVTDQQALPV